VPKGSLNLSLTRSSISEFTIVDMNDRGDYLLLVSPVDATYREYVRLYQGTKTSLGRVTPDIRYFLSPNGNTIRRVGQAQMASSLQSRMLGGPVTSAYNEIRFYRRFNDDGSVLNVRFDQQKKESFFHLRVDKSGVPPVVFYTSTNPMMILEKGDSGDIWVRESVKNNSATDDILWKFNGTNKEQITLPKGYKAVDRVAQTGATLAATFGNIQGTDPLRAFVRANNGWKELPLPDGYSFSYVQKVFLDGSILGFVTDGERGHFKQVVWKGDSVAILDDLPAWPKNGQVSLIVQATRKGDLYVRNVTDTSSGASEYYLLSLKL